MTRHERMGADGEPFEKIAAPGAKTRRRLPLLLGLLVAFVAIWTLFFAISQAGTSIHHDMSEAYAWGKEFQLGYNQHPPLWAWICGLWFSVFPRAGWAFAVLTSLNAGIGLCGAWMLIGDFAQGQKRLAATVLLLLTPFYTFLSYKYNANIIFLSIWPWTLHFFVRTMERREIKDSLFLGLCVGLALMSKYYALILVAACFMAALQHPSRAKYFASASPYVAAAVAAAICAPHVWWLLATGAPPLRYLASVSGQGLGAVESYVAATIFGALWMNMGVFLVVAFAARSSPRDWIASFRLHWPTANFRVLATLALLPAALTILSAFVLRTNITPEMTIGTFSLMPLLAIEIAGGGQIDRLYAIGWRLAAALTLGSLALSPAIALARTWLPANAKEIGPYEEIAIAATKLWHAQTALPVAYVGGTHWYENAFTFYSPDRPSAFVRFDYSVNLWVTPEALAKHGLLSVCVQDDSDCLASTAKFVTPQSTQTEISLAHSFWGHVAKTVPFVVTIIPPRD